MAEEGAHRLAAELCQQLDPVLTRMVEKCGIELTCCILLGICARMQMRASAAGLWNAERYAAMVKLDQVAGQLAAEGKAG